jgi:hypothetical protein
MSDPNTSPSPREDEIHDEEEVDDTVVGRDRAGAAERAGGPDILPSDSHLDPSGPDAA